MEISLTYELYVFLSAVLLGVVEGVIFDFFKAFRKRASKSISTVDVLDIIYWFFATGIFCFFVVYQEGKELRGYIFTALILGMIFYFLIFSRVFNYLLDKIIWLFWRFFKLFFKILLTPLTFLYKILVRFFKRLKNVIFYKSESKK